VALLLLLEGLPLLLLVLLLQPPLRQQPLRLLLLHSLPLAQALLLLALEQEQNQGQLLLQCLARQSRLPHQQQHQQLLPGLLPVQLHANHRQHQPPQQQQHRVQQRQALQ
jgi:hypothetical protein